MKTRRSKGFAFVEMPNDDEAKEAIKQLNGAEYVNRTMVVKEALPKAYEQTFHHHKWRQSESLSPFFLEQLLKIHERKHE